jgi:hypothetical protein
MSPAFWQADLYGESVSLDGKKEDAAWRRAGDELVGELRKDRATDCQEGVLAYERPMLEDGTIEFEFHYISGESEVHPAVGRSAFVLRPGGVKLHVLTDAQWETGNLLPDNEAAIEGGVDDVPLKANDWNKVAISLKGDQLSIAVNGNEVARHTLIEPPAERFFGLFRYVNKTKCRIRHLVYRGDWPQELPDEAHQELAFSTDGPLAEATAQASDTTAIPFSTQGNSLKQQGVSAINEADVSFAESGAAITLATPTAADKPTGLRLKRRIDGGCDIRLDFDQLQLASGPEKTRRGFRLRVLFDAPTSAPDLAADIAVVRLANGKQILEANRAHRGLDGTQQSEPRQIFGEWTGGTFRIVRCEGLAHCLFAEKNSDKFRLLATYPIGFAPISEIQVVGYGDGDSPADAAAPLVRAVAEKLEVRTLRPAQPAARSTAKVDQNR